MERKNSTYHVMFLFIAITLITTGLSSSNQPAFGAVFQCSATLDASNEVPPSASTGTGTMTGTFDDNTGLLSWNISWSGLTGSPTFIFFHGPATAAQNAGAQVNAGIPPTPNIGNALINAGQETDLLNGLWYINIHTTAIGAGEIRGQVNCVPDVSQSFGDFKCWINSVSQSNPPSTIQLEITDQFNQGGPPIVNDLWFPNDYCAAAEKNGQPSPFSPDLNQHYQIWFYPPSFEGPGTDVTVNLEIPQFDDLNGIVIGNLDYIMVPATKVTGPGPQDSVDDQQHWNCYDIEFTNPPLPAPGDFVTLVTQHFEQEADVQRPFVLCAPMIKFDGSQQFGQLLDEHMVCYDLENVTIENTFENLPNTLIDQLGSNTFVANDVEALCVPAFKSFSTVGGISVPIDQSALLLAGVSSVSMWMIPVVIAGIGIGVFVIKRKK